MVTGRRADFEAYWDAVDAELRRFPAAPAIDIGATVVLNANSDGGIQFGSCVNGA